MHRRSTRLSLQVQKSYVEEDFEEERQIDSGDRTKKRKFIRYDGGDYRRSRSKHAVKRSRRSKGPLQDLMDMPLDIVYEIFSFLQPVDLLQLARTTKDLRRILMGRASAFLWKAARSNVLDLPDCPEDLSEPQYAHFMFGPGCNFCGRKLKQISMIWRARVRSCKRCLPAQFLEKTPDWEESFNSETQLAEVMLFMPTISTRDRYGLRYFYCVELDSRWKAEYRKASDKMAWARSMIEQRQKVEEHARACADWYDNMREREEAAQAALFESRKATVVKYLKDLGWEDELSKMRESDPKPQNQGAVLAICQKELTSESLHTLHHFLNDFMTTTRRRRLARERNALYRARIPILDLVLLNWSSASMRGLPFPGTCDVFSDARIRNIVERTPVSRQEDLHEVIPLLPEIACRWEEDVRGQLISMIRLALPDHDLDEATILELAITSFHCRRYSSPPFCRYSDYIRYPQVVTHMCATFDCHNPNDFEYGTIDYDLKDVLNRVTWNRRGDICFSPTNMEILTHVVRMCGLDPRTTTVAQMNGLDPVFECVVCNDECQGRATMKWWGVLLHYLHQPHTIDEIKLVVRLGEQEAATVRARMLEQEERDLSLEHCEELVCKICDEWRGNLPSSKKHLVEVHDVRKPTMDNIEYYSGTYYPRELYWLWPPRSKYADETLPIVVKSEDIFLN